MHNFFENWGRNKYYPAAPTTEHTDDTIINNKEASTMISIENIMTPSARKHYNLNSSAPAKKQAADRSDLVPPNEQAIMSNIDMSRVRVDTFQPNLESFMPDDEKAVNEAEAKQYTSYRGVGDIGLFNHIAGMGNIKGALDDSIYAVRQHNEDGWTFVFCQKLSDGTYTPKLSISQSSLYRLNDAHFNVLNITSSIQRKRAETLIDELEDKYINGVSLDTSNVYEIMDILELLFKVSSLLPESREVAKDGAIVLYEQIREELVLSSSSYVSIPKAYYALLESDLVDLARRLGMSKLALAKKLKEYNLLYLQESSRGYQTKVRVGGSRPCNFYCIYKLEYFDEVTGKEPPVEELDL